MSCGGSGWLRLRSKVCCVASECVCSRPRLSWNRGSLVDSVTVIWEAERGGKNCVSAVLHERVKANGRVASSRR